jgi:hypothetical protein
VFARAKPLAIAIAASISSGGQASPVAGFTATCTGGAGAPVGGVGSAEVA